MFRTLARRIGIAAFCGAAALAGPAFAADYPQRPVSIVVPTTPGGTADILARLIGPRLAERWGQAVVVENKPGAGTLIGSDYVARAKPDGYTLMLTFNELATLPALNPNVRLDVENGLARIGKIGSLPVLVLTRPGIDDPGLPALITRFRANPGQYTYASNGSGSSLQLFTEIFKREAGVDVMHVPYRGALEASMAAIGGEVDLLVQFASGNVINHVKGGKLKAYAVASPQRLEALPAVPAAAEAGLPELRLEAWYGLFAPAGLPDDLAQKINRDLNDVLAEPAIRERLKGINLQVQTGSPSDFDTFFRAEYARWSGLIRTLGIKSSE
ncbi:tripartite tricarboxylate transporter substrate binding protein [Achromobacter sp. NFACC18-2]|uniref:tripartite tricarboxylate transporter substrate binding protein n=1 Tax=Achromobacter sp. NFACC18-2 TaxID=1564112 RepID=UPI0008BE6B76|nr:tripartite tricarboxylate transporter substrate binding protein [Achromobacter sp. NFACC18-2]SEI37941.1 Tripartite-type tricarboxylate transporter, receptor component TctC [Achromobacter sp. NFACC18-2]